MIDGLILNKKIKNYEKPVRCVISLSLPFKMIKKQLILSKFLRVFLITFFKLTVKNTVKILMGFTAKK